MKVIRRITRQDWYVNSFQVAQLAPRAFEQRPKMNANSDPPAEFPPDWLEPLHQKMRSTPPKSSQPGSLPLPATRHGLRWCEGS